MSQVESLIGAFLSDKNKFENYSIWEERAIAMIDQQISTLPGRRVEVVSVLGPQGAGKGTMIKAMSLTGKHYNDMDFRLDKGLIITGTGGICKPELGSEYERLFKGLQVEAAGHVGVGSLVPPEYLNPALLLTVALRISQNSSKIVIDGWPRSERQYEGMQALISHNGSIHTSALELRLLDKSVIDQMLSDKKFTAEYMRMFGEQVSSSQIDSSNYLSLEYSDSLSRALGRGLKTGREDDMQVEVVMRRIRGYYSESGPMMWDKAAKGLLDLSVISANRPASDVVIDFGKVFIGDKMDSAMGTFAQGVAFAITN